MNFVALPVPEIIGGTRKNGQSLDMPSKMFHGLLFGWTLLLFWPNLKFVVYTFLEFWVGLRIPILGKRRT